MASRKTAGELPSDCAHSRSAQTQEDALRRMTPLQRLLTQGTGIPMRADQASDDLELFTPEERRELQRGNAEQCEANRELRAVSLSPRLEC